MRSESKQEVSEEGAGDTAGQLSQGFGEEWGKENGKEEEYCSDKSVQEITDTIEGRNQADGPGD